MPFHPSRRLAILSVLSLLAACTAVGPAFQAAPEPPEGKALVYVFRQQGGPLGGRDAYFYVDDKNIVDLIGNGYSRFYVSAGEHKLQQAWPFDVNPLMRKLQLPVNWQAGQTYYYRFAVSGGFEGYVDRTLAVRYQLTPLSRAAAMAELGGTKFQPPFEPR